MAIQIGSMGSIHWSRRTPLDKTRVRFGLDLRLPFGLFKNAGVFVIYVKTDDVQKFAEGIGMIRAVLLAAGAGDVANRIMFDVSV